MVWTFLLQVLLLITSLPHLLSLDDDEVEKVLYRKFERRMVQFPCVRLFSSEGSIGCRSPDDNGQVGVLVDVKRHSYVISQDMTFFFVAVIPGELFNSSVIDFLVASEKLEGVIVYDDVDSDYSYMNRPGAMYSTEVRTPQGEDTAGGHTLAPTLAPTLTLTLTVTLILTLTNIGQFTIVPNHAWNNFGNGLAQTLQNYPIVRADSKEIPVLMTLCRENYENDYQLNKMHSAQLSFYMGRPDLTSLDCLGWRDIDGKRNPQVRIFQATVCFQCPFQRVLRAPNPFHRNFYN